MKGYSTPEFEHRHYSVGDIMSQSGWILPGTVSSENTGSDPEGGFDGDGAENNKWAKARATESGWYKDETWYTW